MLNVVISLSCFLLLIHPVNFMKKKVIFSNSNVTKQNECCSIGLWRHTLRNRICESPCCIMCIMTLYSSSVSSHGSRFRVAPYCIDTYSMTQSPSWETSWIASSQEIPHISRNPKVHYRTHKRPPPVPILGQPNPVHIPTSHLLEIHPNIIHPSTPRSSQWSLSLLLY